MFFEQVSWSFQGTSQKSDYLVSQIIHGRRFCLNKSSQIELKLVKSESANICLPYAWRRRNLIISIIKMSSAEKLRVNVWSKFDYVAKAWRTEISCGIQECVGNGTKQTLNVQNVCETKQFEKNLFWWAVV